MIDTANRRASLLSPRDPNVTDAGERRRLAGQNLRFYRLLATRDRVTNVELAKRALKYTGRISDLRAIGCIIVCEKVPGRPGVRAYSMRDPAWNPRPGYSVNAHHQTREIVGVRTDRRGRRWVIYRTVGQFGVLRVLLGTWRSWAAAIARPEIGAGNARAAARSAPKRKARA